MLFTCPAKYQRRVEAALAIALAEIGRDVRYRADEDEYIRNLAPVDASMIDHDAAGRLIISIDVDPTHALPGFADRGEHLVAFSPLTR